MILRVDRQQSDAILGAMRTVALVHGEGAVSDADSRTIAAAAQIVFGRDPADAERVGAREPDQLADAMLDGGDAQQAVRMLAVMALVDGSVDPEKTQLVNDFARELSVSEAYLEVLTEAAAGEVAAAAACMIRKNAASFPHLDASGIDKDAIAPFLPYRDAADPALEARYAALGELPDNTFGRAFFEHFARNGFAFPGNPGGLAEGFTTPHDSSHVLAGYSTSQQGELCVSTFIGAMHPDHPMSAEVLPVLFSWHLGIHLNDIAGASTGAFEPRKFWTAWDRGSATTTDVVAAEWDFWAAVEADLEELRRSYELPAAGPELLA
jgi:tellurite resistance protein